jgi:hypothetical protein
VGACSIIALYSYFTLPSFPSQIYNGRQLYHFIDGYDLQRSNWMRYVNPAHSLSEQNLVACQNGRDVYFYTSRPVEPKQELLVWYSQDFAQRLCSQPGEELKQSEWPSLIVVVVALLSSVHSPQLLSLFPSPLPSPLVFPVLYSSLLCTHLSLSLNCFSIYSLALSFLWLYK